MSSRKLRTTTLHPLRSNRKALKRETATSPTPVTSGQELLRNYVGKRWVFGRFIKMWKITQLI